MSLWHSARYVAGEERGINPPAKTLYADGFPRSRSR